jgi:hypothetical protein
MPINRKFRGPTDFMDVRGRNQLAVIPEASLSKGAGNIGGVRKFSERDQGLSSLKPSLKSPEVDLDYRARSGYDLMLDQENLTYIANYAKYGTFGKTVSPTPTLLSSTQSSVSTGPVVLGPINTTKAATLRIIVNSTSNAIPTITDSYGNGWVQDGATLNNSFYLYAMKPSLVGPLVTGPNHTVTMSDTSANVTAQFIAVASGGGGLVTATAYNPVITSTNPYLGTAISTTGPALLIGFLSSNPNVNPVTYTWNNGFVQFQDQPDSGDYNGSTVAALTVSAPGTYTPSCGLSTGSTSGIGCYSFSEAVAMSLGYSDEGLWFNQNFAYFNGIYGTLSTYKTFTIQGTETLLTEFDLSWILAPGASGSGIPAGAVFELGIGLKTGTSSTGELFDGVFLRVTSAGVYLVTRNNSTTDTLVAQVFKPDGLGATAWVPSPEVRYTFGLRYSAHQAQLAVYDPKASIRWIGAIIRSTTNTTLTASPSGILNIWFGQVATSAYGVAMAVGRWSVLREGMNASTTLPEQSARSMEGLLTIGYPGSGGPTTSAGSVSRSLGGVLTNNAPAVSSLVGGIIQETPTYALNTDVILCAYRVSAQQVVTGTFFPVSQRMRIDGIRLSSAVFTTLTGGGFVKNWYFAYGSQLSSLAGVVADSATQKAYRRIQLELTHAYTSGQVVGTIPTQLGGPYVAFKEPIYLNQNECWAIVCSHTGTAPTAGVIEHQFHLDYGWE